VAERASKLSRLAVRFERRADAPEPSQGSAASSSASTNPAGFVEALGDPPAFYGTVDRTAAGMIRPGDRKRLGLEAIKPFGHCRAWTFNAFSN
jgi:hypothetical protein